MGVAAPAFCCEDFLDFLMLYSYETAFGDTLGSLRSEDGDGRESVAEKVNSRSFNLHRGYSKSLTLSNVGEPS